MLKCWELDGKERIIFSIKFCNWAKIESKKDMGVQNICTCHFFIWGTKIYLLNIAVVLVIMDSFVHSISKTVTPQIRIRSPT